MKHNFIASAAVVLAALGMLSLSACSHKKDKAEAASMVERDSLNAPRVVPAVVATAEVNSTSRIDSIDAKSRTVTLVNAAGEMHKYKCGPEVRNFDQLRAGDTVNATIVEQLAIYVRKNGVPPSAAAGAMIARAARGDKPGVMISEVVQRNATITAVDPDKHTVTVKNVEGETKTYSVNPEVDLMGVRVGDDVVAQYSRGLEVLVSSAAPDIAAAQTASLSSPSKLTPDEARAIATDAYIFGYPLVTMDFTRRVMTNVERPAGTHAPMGQFARLREYPTAAFRDITAPNADTLYTTTWLDVSKEPWVLSVPNSDGRYYLMPMLDGWTTVFQAPGTRTTGDGAGAFAITGPNWKGALPAGVKECKSPTSMVWILGRIYCTGTPEDYQKTHAMQDKISVVPLSSWGRDYAAPEGKIDPSIDGKVAVREQVNKLDAAAYFTLLAQLMKDNPPAAEDALMVAKMAKLGIVPGQDFDASKLDPAAAQALHDVPRIAFEKIMGYFKEAGKRENGWVFTTQTGTYGTDYTNRALVTAIGLGANLPQDAVYPTADADAAGQPYLGSNKYVMHFDKGRMPPAEAFWSITMYDGNYFFVQNALNRQNLSSRDKFVENADGSVDLYFQHETPGKEKEANWLPAPEGKFILMLRLYRPRETAPSIIDGSWTIPAVKQAQ